MLPLTLGARAATALTKRKRARDSYASINSLIGKHLHEGGMLLDGFGWDYVFGFMAGISCLTFLVVLTIAEPLNVRQ